MKRVCAESRIGQRFERIVILEIFYRKFKGGGKTMYAKTRCDCGKLKNIAVQNLVKGHTRSCGCYNKEVLSVRSKKHGYSRTRTYRIWRHMRSRCESKTHSRYAEWGGRGITVCERWKKFENFLTDMGEAPKNASIDRIDNNKGYFLENCRWADAFIQAQNKNWDEDQGVRKQPKCNNKWKARFTLFGERYVFCGFNSKEEAIVFRKNKIDEIRLMHKKCANI